MEIWIEYRQWNIQQREVITFQQQNESLQCENGKYCQLFSDHLKKIETTQIYSSF